MKKIKAFLNISNVVFLKNLIAVNNVIYFFAEMWKYDIRNVVISAIYVAVLQLIDWYRQQKS